MSPSALDGVKVLEFATMVSGPYCAKLLGDLGADVIKVESAEGDPARRCGPFPPSGPDPEQSALFLYNNTSKRGVTLDLNSADGAAEFKKLAAWADILIDNHAPSVLESHGLGWDELHELNPGLIYTSITPYGRTGPRANAKGGELTLCHAGGIGNLLPIRSVDINRPPIKLGGYQVGYHGAIAAALATLGTLIGRGESGEGRLIDVSLEEAMIAMLAPTISSARYHHSTWNRVPDRPPALGRMQTKDGYVVLNAIDDHQFRSLRQLMGNPDWCAGDEWDSMAYRVHHLMDIASRMDEWMLKQEKNDVHHKGSRARIPIGPINSAADVMNNPQYEARGYFQEVDHPKAGRHRYAGVPYKYSATPHRISRPAPLLGEHNDEIKSSDREPAVSIAANVANPGNPGNTRNNSSSNRLPLEGVRIFEFCWVWAGPYAGMLLAHLGAEVIKVEGPRRTDLMRRVVVWPLPDPEPTQVSPNGGIAFNSVNLNKKSLTLDLSKPEGVELAKQIGAKCDVVVDNMRPGALDKLGLGHDDFRRLRPDIIVASSSGRGHEGPERNYPGFAPVHHAIGGGAYLTGFPDDHPSHSYGDVDIMNAHTLAFSILAALHHRSRTGEGQSIDYSQCEGVSSLIGEALLGYEMTSVIPERMGNAHETDAPHNVYPAWGVDRWLALEVHSDEEFDALARVIGQPELASDPRFADMKSRKKNEAELDAIIEAWTRARDRDGAVDQLREAGLAAAPSREARDLYADAHLRAREAFMTIDHPELGELELVGPPWKISGCETPKRPAPLLGEHTESILREFLGLDDERLADLHAKEVIS